MSFCPEYGYSVEGHTAPFQVGAVGRDRERKEIAEGRERTEGGREE